MRRMMPRKLEVVLPSGQVSDFLREVQRLDGLSSLHVASTPTVAPADQTLVTMSGSNELASRIHHILHDPRFDGASVSTSELQSLATTAEPARARLAGEGSEMNWQEMATFLRKETNPSGNFFTLMALCGAIAAVGLWKDMLHFVLGAMVVAPGFQPLLRFPYALAAPREHVGRGLVSTFGGYAALAASAAVLTLLLSVIEPSAESLRERSWVQFWSTVGPASVVMAILGGLAGAATISAGRPVLTAGVMIVLALVPSSAIVGMALAQGDVGLSARAAGRWLLDAGLVIVAGGALLMIKRRFWHRHEKEA